MLYSESERAIGNAQRSLPIRDGGRVGCAHQLRSLKRKVTYVKKD